MSLIALSEQYMGRLVSTDEKLMEKEVQTIIKLSTPPIQPTDPEDITSQDIDENVKEMEKMSKETETLIDWITESVDYAPSKKLDISTATMYVYGYTDSGPRGINGGLFSTEQGARYLHRNEIKDKIENNFTNKSDIKTAEDQVDSLPNSFGVGTYALWPIVLIASWLKYNLLTGDGNVDAIKYICVDIRDPDKCDRIENDKSTLYVFPMITTWDSPKLTSGYAKKLFRCAFYAWRNKSGYAQWRKDWRALYYYYGGTEILM